MECGGGCGCGWCFNGVVFVGLVVMYVVSDLLWSGLSGSLVFAAAVCAIQHILWWLVLLYFGTAF